LYNREQCALQSEKWSIYNNRIVNLFGQQRDLRGRSDRRGSGTGGGRGRTTGADRLMAGVGGAGSGGQAKIALRLVS